MSSPNNKASLGCGTLILIALIVMIFGNSNRDVDKDLKSEISALRADVKVIQSELSGLKADIRKQSETLSTIGKTVDEIKNLRIQPRPRVVPPAQSAGSPELPPLPEAPLPEN